MIFMLQRGIILKAFIILDNLIINLSCNQHHRTSLTIMIILSGSYLILGGTNLILGRTSKLIMLLFLMLLPLFLLLIIKFAPLILVFCRRYCSYQLLCMSIGLFGVMRLWATRADANCCRLLGFGNRFFVYLDDEKLKARF